MLCLWLHKPLGNCVKRVVTPTPLCAFLIGRQRDVCDVDARHLTRQGEHLVHRNPGSNRCIAQAGLADCFLHAAGAQLRNITQDYDDGLFSCAYLRGFATLDGPNGLSGDVTPFADFVC
jgi:hypothetical protein